MASPLSDLDLVNAALVKLGALPIRSFDDADASAGVAAALYPVVAEATLTAHPWSFTLKRARLGPLDGAPLADFGARFPLPADFLRAIYVDDRGSSPRYAIVAGELHTDARDVVLTYQFRPGEDVFPPFFRAALVAKLAAELCIPVTESTARAEALDRLAERELERAWSIDRAQETPPLVGDDSLVRVRS
jgi:hypothetical protein